MYKATRFALFVALSAFSIGLVVHAEELNPEGFPADWSEEDFDPTGGMDEKDDVENISIAPYGSSSTAGALKRGMASFAVNEMPSVNISTTITSSTTVSTSTISATSASATLLPLSSVFGSSTVPAGLQPKLKGEDLSAPADAGASALGSYGVIRRNFQWGNVKGVQDSWQNAIDRIKPVAETSEETALTRIALRRALSSALAAAVPAPQGMEAEDWLAWRMERLMELGNADLAWQLARPITPIARERNANLRRAWAEVSLLVGDVPNACNALKTEAQGAQVAANTGPGAVLPYWRQSVMVCQALERGRDGLGLSLAAATADGLVFPPLLQTLLESIAENGPAPKVPAGSRAGVLESALYAAYPALIREEVWPTLPNVVLWRLVRTEALPLSLRTQAAEWLVAQDADNLVPASSQTTPADALAQLYGLFNFTPEQLSGPIQSATKLNDDAQQRALLWQSALKGNLNGWQGWSSHAATSGLVGLAAAMPVPGALLEQTSSVPPLLLATRQAIRAGNYPEAQKHYAKLKNAEGLSLPNLRARAALGVLLGTFQKTDTAAALTQWQVALPVATVAGKQASLAQLALFIELGLPLTDDAKAGILQRVGDVPGGAQWPLWQPLVLDALAEGKTASALAQVASAMPEAGGIVPGWVQPAMRTLASVGDDDARRRLALALALSGINETPPAPAAVPTTTSATTTSGSVSMPLLDPSKSLVAPLDVQFQFLSTPATNAASTPNWLLPPPRVPAPVAPTKPTAPRP